MPFGNQAWIRPHEALSQLPTTDGTRFASVLHRSAFDVEIYAPRGIDAQAPHSRDEIYVVIAGTGMFRNGGRTHSFGPGDLMFVPAGVEHRFEAFDDDLAVWVIFSGDDPSAAQGGR